MHIRYVCIDFNITLYIVTLLLSFIHFCNYINNSMILNIQKKINNSRYDFRVSQICRLAEGSADTWWILLHNDRKSRHRRIKKQRRYGHLRCFTSQLSLRVIGGVIQGGWVRGRTIFWPSWGCYWNVLI